MAVEQPFREYAERPKEGELWREMIERQQREGNKQEGYIRELLRSLPNEQQQDKEGRELGDISPFDFAQQMFMADDDQPSFDDMLAEASQRGEPEQDLGLER